MRHAKTILALLALTGLSCRGAKARDQVRECSAISLDAQGTARCLVQLYEWKADAARTAALARHRELDSLKAWQEDSVWSLDAARHRVELRACRRGADPLDRCLLISGWPLARVTAAAESLWQAEAPEHLRELQACQRRREVNLASCLTLYYKWDSERALRTADSITRERLGGRSR